MDLKGDGLSILDHGNRRVMELGVWFGPCQVDPCLTIDGDVKFKGDGYFRCRIEVELLFVEY